MDGIDIAFIVFAVVCCLFFMFLAWNSSSAETKEQKKPKAPQQTLTPAEREMQEQTKMLRRLYWLTFWNSLRKK
jgi:hypothetical protein